jgi:hypothetical protein
VLILSDGEGPLDLTVEEADEILKAGKYQLPLQFKSFMTHCRTNLAQFVLGGAIKHRLLEGAQVNQATGSHSYFSYDLAAMDTEEEEEWMHPLAMSSLSELDRLVTTVKRENFTPVRFGISRDKQKRHHTCDAYTLLVTADLRLRGIQPRSVTYSASFRDEEELDKLLGL